MLNVTTFDVIGMVIAAVVLIGLALWAQGFRDKPRDLVGNRNTFFAVSAVLLVISFGAMLFKGFNFGMDFAGGTIIEIGFVDNQERITPEAVRKEIEEYSTENKLGFQEAQVQVEEKAIGSAPDPFRRVIIRVGKSDKKNLTTGEIEGLASFLEKKLGKLYRQASKGLDIPTPGASGSPAASPSAGASSSPGAAASSSPGAAASSSPGASPSAVASNAPAASPSAGASGSPASPGASPSSAPSGAPTAAASGTPGASPSGAPGATPSPAVDPNSISAALLARETIDPVIGSELWINSLLALVVALVLQLLYITLRFGNQVRYGLAADVALIHDVIIMAGLYALTSRQVDSPFLAALLTVIGYSVMDSIVVFDRIRENVRHSRKGNYAEICNQSVNQTMSRSVNTTLTVLLTLFALYFFGGDTLRNFAFALLVGITAGAYSSIFIATPLVVMFDDWTKKREEDRVSERRRAREAASTSSSDEPSESRTPMRRRATDAAANLTDAEAGEVEDDDPRRSGASRRRKTRRRRP